MDNTSRTRSSPASLASPGIGWGVLTGLGKDQQVPYLLIDSPSSTITGLGLISPQTRSPGTQHVSLHLLTHSRLNDLDPLCLHMIALLPIDPSCIAQLIEPYRPHASIPSSSRRDILGAMKGRPRLRVAPCQFCNKEFKRQEHLDRHIRTRKYSISFNSVSRC